MNNTQALTKPLRKELEVSVEDLCLALNSMGIIAPENYLDVTNRKFIGASTRFSHYAIEEIKDCGRVLWVIPQIEVLRPIVQVYTDMPSPGQGVPASVTCCLNPDFQKNEKFLEAVYGTVGNFFRKNNLPWTCGYWQKR